MPHDWQDGHSGARPVPGNFRRRPPGPGPPETVFCRVDIAGLQRSPELSHQKTVGREGGNAVATSTAAATATACASSSGVSDTNWASESAFPMWRTEILEVLVSWG